ncbi:MAG: hypothetical protein HYY65_04110 [Candidatus Tectomicrobia bacterium]|uniref:Uncharacterized protein n=1 Tax=Tectimicrobiota bacterium TaxID=2528274 RepID=A0A932GNU0_UNCTE|nr:hypothetical protein [Candidatus Tectomicrobia bacterium]
MQTHQLADLLESLAQACRAAPDVEISAVFSQLGIEIPRRTRSGRPKSTRLPEAPLPGLDVEDLRKMSREDLVACLRSPRHFRTKGDLVALGRSCEIAVNEKMKREEIVERIARQFHDLPQGRQILGSFPAG